MLGYFWNRFTTSEGAVSNIAHIQINDYEAAIAERDAQIAVLKRDLQHKADLAESYKGATERRDERIKELERQNNEYILQYAMQSDSVAVLEKQVSELSREREEFVQKYESARDAMREMKCLIHQHQRAFDSEYRRSFDDCEPDSNLSPKGDKTEHVASCEELRKYFPKVNKTDGDTAEYPAPVNAIADTTSHGE